MTVRECLYSSGMIEANNLVEIDEGGYTQGIAYVDYEDLSTLALPNDLLECEVKEVQKNCQFTCKGGTVDVYRILI